jgi:glyoxylase-like metal-dependent hydrolase (beta-lactamase superfamily II)
MSSEASPPSPYPAQPALEGLVVLERGWLSSNNTVVLPAAGEPGATVIDTGHVNHAEQTEALIRQVLGGVPLARIVNTHLHSDHCGGNARLHAAFGASVWVPPGQAQAVRDWDENQLSHTAAGQRLGRFAVQGVLRAGEVLEAGGRRFEALAAPGHDPHSLMLYDAEHQLLISADALWENGFGVVFPEVAGESGFAEVGATLDLIESLPVALVIPGHGAPFADVSGALSRARRRLSGFVAEPGRHARHAAKVLIKYHVMEERVMARQALQAWAVATPLMAELCARFPANVGATPEQAAQDLIDELLAQKVLRQQADVVHDA